MFQLIIDNVTAQISPTTKIRLEMKSTLADSEILRAKVVYPIDLPFCKINDEIFKNASIIHVIYNYKVYSCQLIFKGKMLIPGELILLSTNSNGYHVTIIDKGMSSELTDKLLTEIDIPESIMVEKPHFELADYMTKVAKSEIITDFEVPMVYAPQFYGENNNDFGLEDPSFALDPEENEGGRGKYKNRWNVDHFNWNKPSIVNAMNVYTFVPFPKLEVVLNKIFKANDINCFGSFIKKAIRDKIILNNDRTLDDNFKYSVKCKMRKLSQQILWRNNDNHATASYHLTFSVINSFLTNYDTAYEFGSYSWSTGMSWQSFTAPQIPEYPNLTCEYSINMNLYLYLHRTSIATVISIEIWMYNPGTTTPHFVRRTDFTPPPDNYFTYNLNYQDSIDLPAGSQIYFVLRHRGISTYGSSPGNTQIGVITSVQDSFIEIKNTTLELFNAGTSIFKLNKHLPEVSFGEFLNILRQTFGIVFYSNNNTREFEMSTIEELYNSNGYVDLSMYVIPDSYEKVFNEVTPQSFRYNHETETPENAKWPSTEVKNFHDLPKGNAGDKIAVIADGMVYQYSLIEEEDQYKWVPVYPYSKTVNDKAEILDINCTVLANTERINKLIPTTSKKAISEKFSTDGTNNLGILYYKGLSSDRSNPAKTYPFATSYNIDVNGNEMNCLPMFESGNGSNGEENTLQYLEASNNFEQSKCLFKIPLPVMEQLFFLLQPQRTTPANAKRKIMLNSVKFIPLTISFNVESTSDYIETEIIMIKDAR